MRKEGVQGMSTVLIAPPDGKEQDMGKLLLGAKIPLRGGGVVTVIDSGKEELELGEGLQGYVYKVQYPDGRIAALKWYKKSYLRLLKEKGKQATGAQRGRGVQRFYENLCELTEMDAPHEAFVWPRDVTMTHAATGCFGYVMDLIPDDYAKMAELLNRKVGMSLTVLCDMAIKLCEVFEALHTRGYSYQDLNPNGVYVNTLTGEVLVCDTDNVAPDGTTVCALSGSTGFMAPEVVMAKAAPSRVTDQHSLLVMFFWLVVGGHPLVGRLERCMPVRTAAGLALLFGEKATFVFDPSGNNGPIKGVQDDLAKAWEGLPQFFRDACLRGFSREALHSLSRGILEENRLSASELRELFMRLRSQVTTCPICHRRFFADPIKGNSHCPVCERPIPTPMCLVARVGDPIPVCAGKTVYECDVMPYGSYGEAFLKMGSNPRVPTAIGLINCGSIPWELAFRDGTHGTVSPGCSQIVTDGHRWLYGLRIHAGAVDMAIERSGASA